MPTAFAALDLPFELPNGASANWLTRSQMPPAHYADLARGIAVDGATEHLRHHQRVGVVFGDCRHETA